MTALESVWWVLIKTDTTTFQGMSYILLGGYISRMEEVRSST